MAFRFGVALLLVVLVSLTGTALEKRALELRRAVTRQHFRLDVLAQRHAAKQAVAQQLGAPARLVERLDPRLLDPDHAEERSPSGAASAPARHTAVRRRHSDAP